MKPYSRSDRVAGLIQKVLAELLHKEIGDPQLAKVTITAVKMSRDLRLAKIYFATDSGDQNKQKALNGFNRAKGFVKRELAQRLGLRYMPELRFYYDEAIDRGARIELLIKQARENDQAHH